MDATPRDPLVDALAQTAFATMAALTRIAARHDLSLTQLRVLAILRGRRLRMTALAEHLGLEKSTMTGLVARAEKRGLLARIPGDDDRRAVDVIWGPAALTLSEQLAHEVERALAPMTETLTAAERDRLRELLDRMLGS